MLPQMSSTVLNWTDAVTLRIISKKAVDFEVKEVTLETPTIEMMLTTMSPRKIERKPEGERRYKWWDGISTEKIELDTVLQDPEGLYLDITLWEI